MAEPPVQSGNQFAASNSVALQRLTLLGQRLAATIHRSIAVEQTAGLLLHVLSPDGILIVVFDPQTKEPSVLYEHHYGDRRSDDPLVRLVIREGARVLPRVTDDAVKELGVEVAETVRSWVGVPIPAAGQNVGAISLASARPGRFDEWHRDFAGAVAAQLGIALQNMRLLELLSNGKREWEQTVDAIGQAFCVIDPAGKIRRANRAFGNLVEVPLTALAGHPWASVLPKDWVEPIAQILAPNAGPVQRDARLGGRVFSVSVLDLPGPDDLSVLVFEDQTEKRRLQEQLIQSEKMSAIGQLIAGVAHDLNNPLASVVGFADYLMEGIRETPEKIRQPLAAIRQEAERAASIVRNLLSFARKQEEQRQPQAIGPVLQATLQLLNNQLMSLKVSAHLELEENLPLVEIDANQLQQVFVNLLNNAAQAIAATGKPGDITVRARRWLDGVSVTVEDDGPGIDPSIAGRIFEPFFTTKEEGEGTGLGLSICHGIVTEHGGRISYERPEGGGAAFRVELPGVQENAASGPLEKRAPTRALRVLVVDDEPHIRHYMVATLESWGHQVTLAADGRDALERSIAESFDVIITDLRMPALGGKEFYEELTRRRPAAADRVVFATGDTVRGDALAFLESSGRPCLQKPFTLAQLKAALAEAAG